MNIVIGALYFLFVVLAVSIALIHPDDPIVSPDQIISQSDSDPSHLQGHVVVKAKVKEIKKVPLYGYAYKVADNMYIVNFSRGDFKVGDTIEFRIAGAVNMGDSYLVLAYYEE